MKSRMPKLRKKYLNEVAAFLFIYFFTCLCGLAQRSKIFQAALVSREITCHMENSFDIPERLRGRLVGCECCKISVTRCPLEGPGNSRGRPWPPCENLHFLRKVSYTPPGMFDALLLCSFVCYGIGVGVVSLCSPGWLQTPSLCLNLPRAGDICHHTPSHVECCVSRSGVYLITHG